MTAPPPYEGPARPQRSNTMWVVFAVVGVIALCGCGGILAAILFPVFAQAREAALRTSCLRNVRLANQGVLLYATDNDDSLPPAEKWVDLTEVHSKHLVRTCPKLKQGQYGYAMNSEVSGKNFSKISSFSSTLGVFESSVLGKNAKAKPSEKPNPPRHEKKINVGYLDGHVESITP